MNFGRMSYLLFYFESDDSGEGEMETVLSIWYSYHFHGDFDTVGIALIRQCAASD